MTAFAPQPSPNTDAPVTRPRVPRAVQLATTVLGRVGSFLRARWFCIDHRTLGLFRIVFGICLLGTLYDHAANGQLTTFFSNDGVVTNHYALFEPLQPRAWSILFAFSRPAEVGVAFAAIALVYILFILGWKTKVMQILVIVCSVSIANRNLLLQDGGVFVSNILALWTAFLPLGVRYSLDSLIERRGGSAIRASDTSVHVSVVCFFLLAQLAVIYGFNAANKSGATWKTGSAVHYILWQNSYNTALAGLLRHHEPAWFSPALTWGTLAFEWAAPALILMPFLQTVCRRVVIAAAVFFHLGIASLMTLGPFSYVMISYSLLLLGARDWSALEKLGGWIRMRRPVTLVRAKAHPLFHRLVTVVTGRSADAPTEPDSHVQPFVPGRHGRARRVMREGLAIVLGTAILAEITLVNAAVPPALRWENRPSWMAEILYYLRIYQTWGMFSADAPESDGRIVVDAVLADGSHIDPLTGQPPDFQAPLGGPYGLGHDWAEYMLYIPWERHRGYHAGLRDYIAATPGRKRWPPERKILSFEVYRVSAHSPRPGEMQPYDLKSERLFAHTISPR